MSALLSVGRSWLRFLKLMFPADREPLLPVILLLLGAVGGLDMLEGMRAPVEIGAGLGRFCVVDLGNFGRLDIGSILS